RQFFDWGAPRPFLLETTMTTTYEAERALTREVTREVESGLPGVEVLAVELLAHDHFCVYVDHPAGVDHALCERVTNVLRSHAHRSTVAVSSRGFDRPLRTPAHSRQFVGRRVTLRTPERKRLRGEVVCAGERTVTVRAGDEDIEIPYELIVRG